MQLITFTPPDKHLWIGQAERLRCEVYTDGIGGMAITGDKFISLEGRLRST